MPATLIRNKVAGFRGSAKLYRVEPPVAYSVYTGGGLVESKTDHVIVSAVPAAFDTGESETYIFPADPSGEILNWGELEGSFRGDMDHDRALKGAGYEVIS